MRHAPGSPLMQCVEQLGDAIERAFEEVAHDERRFSDIAAEALGEFTALDGLKISDLVPDLIEMISALPDVPDVGFSDLGTVLVNRKHFCIQLLLWTEGTTSVHQHAFSGAVRLLLGSSLQTKYSFAESERINSRFRVGHVRRVGAALLTQDDVEPIESGAALTHAVLHLNTPSATLVVRTHQENWSKPQLLIRPPHLAFDGFSLQADAHRASRMLAVSSASGSRQETLARLVRQLPIELVAYLLPTIIRDDQDGDTVWPEVTRRLGNPLSELVRASVESDRKHREAVSLRRSIDDVELRLIIGLMCFAEDFEDLRRLMQTVAKGLHSPGDEWLWTCIARIMMYPSSSLHIGEVKLEDCIAALCQSETWEVAERMIVERFPVCHETRCQLKKLHDGVSRMAIFGALRLGP